MNALDWESLKSMIDHYINQKTCSIAIYFSPDGAMNVTLSPTEDAYEIELTDEDIEMLNRGNIIHIETETYEINIKKE